MIKKMSSLSSKIMGKNILEDSPSSPDWVMQRTKANIFSLCAIFTLPPEEQKGGQSPQLKNTSAAKNQDF